jgi:hypothetical protein
MSIAIQRKVVLALGLVSAILAACGKGDDQVRQGYPNPSALSSTTAEQKRVDAGIAAAAEDNPNSWAPSPESVAGAKKDAAAPPIQMVDDGISDIALGNMPRPPAPPPPPKLATGDEAVQYGLPAWEQIARGELRVKRIQY